MRLNGYMAQGPNDPDRRDDSDDENEGMPQDFQAMFNQLFGQLGGSAQQPEGMEELLAQVQRTLSQLNQSGQTFGGVGGINGLFGAGGPLGGSTEGGVNWDLANDTARKTSLQLGPDPVPTAAQQERVREAVTIAEVWLDDVTDLPRVPGEPVAWSRAEWIENTQPVWQRLVEPVASSIADAMQSALTPPADEIAEAGGQFADIEKMFAPLVRSSGAGMFGIQLGQALAQLAGEVVGATDIGLPLHERVALLPGGVAKFGDGLDQSTTDVHLYLALRECARQRLFHGTTWLSSTLLSLVEEYARGIRIDSRAIEDAVSDMDLSNIEELQERLTGSLFSPQRTPEQEAVLVRLETMLALVEGWVDHVVAQAAARWMPAAVPLAETMRRRRASGGPAEATFATLVGLELRPRRLRDAANLWAALQEKRGAQARDEPWSHPDVMPSTADLDDPLGFVESGPRRGGDSDSSGTDFDAELAKLLDAEQGRDNNQDGDPGGRE